MSISIDEAIYELKNNARGSAAALALAVEALEEKKQRAAADNPCWNEICRKAGRQRLKGIEKYGQGVEMNPAGILFWMENLEEEQIDGLMYTERALDALRAILGER